MAGCQAGAMLGTSWARVLTLFASAFQVLNTARKNLIRLQTWLHLLELLHFEYMGQGDLRLPVLKENISSR